ncbi:unnamed protein product [[Candida] boidinii]|uniref:Unnamed protein product n=1 Tax=Candida boidinii TaxID=5477 RepID=A0A9W6T1E3_CANBO|nr:hypothetical protein B5S30_g5549 [[Candida] boidinii]GME73495.1 unnamed protein product [[Candida] boidinii]
MSLDTIKLELGTQSSKIEKLLNSNSDDLHEILDKSIKSLQDLLNKLTNNEEENYVFQDILPLISHLINLIHINTTTTFNYPYSVETQLRKITSIVLVIFINLKNSFPLEFEDELNDQLDDIITTSESKNDAKSLFLKLNELFPLFPSMCSKIFTSNENFIILITREINIIINNSSINATAGSSKVIGSDTIINDEIYAILKLFSGACIDESCRVTIAEHYSSFIIRMLKFNFHNYHDSKTNVNNMDKMNKTQIQRENIKLYLYNQIISSLIIIKVWNNLKKEVHENNKDFMTLDLLSEVLIDGINESSNIADSNDNSNDNNDHTDEANKIKKESVEGLMYISLNIKFKQNLRNDNSFIDSLLAILFKGVKKLEETENKDSITNEATQSKQDVQLLYGCLCIISNLTIYNKKLSDDEQSFQSLKDYAQLKTIDKQTGERRKEAEKDNDEDISKFIDNLLISKNFINDLTQLTKLNVFNNSTGLRNQIVLIISNFTTLAKFRKEIVKQNGFNYLLNFLVNTSNEINYNLLNNEGIILYKENTKININDINDPNIRFNCIKSIARIMMNNNPNLIFNKFANITPIPFLLEILCQYDIETNGNNYGNEKLYLSPLNGVHISPVDVFEVLIALTNLSSLEDIQVKKLIIHFCWTQIKNLMLSLDSQIQRSDLELLSNLIMVPTCTQKFFDWEINKDDITKDGNEDTEESDKRKNFLNFRILCKLIGSLDLKSQIATLNIFANSSEYEMISMVLMQSEIFLNHLFEVLDTQGIEEEELTTRCFYILLNGINAVSESKDIDKTEILGKFKALNDWEDAILKIVRATSDEDIKEMGLEILKALK